jgi:hypothetical protein
MVFARLRPRLYGHLLRGKLVILVWLYLFRIVFQVRTLCTFPECVQEWNFCVLVSFLFAKYHTPEIFAYFKTGFLRIKFLRNKNA